MVNFFRSRKHDDQRQTAESRDAPVAIDNPAVQRLADGIASVIRGKAELIRDFLIGILANGSILIEDLPGVGKTTLAKTFASLVDLKFDRVQCTPDLLPADVLGFSIYNAQEGSLLFRQGPIFCNLLLVDEINRASPRTQSALLEAMAEGQVTIDGQSRPLPTPFLVVATQNPVGFHGTYPLPEAQLDRFLLNLTIDYPDHESELSLLFDSDKDSEAAIPCVLNADELINLQRKVLEVKVHRDVAEYIIAVVRKTREEERFRLGCSPRGAQMLYRASKASALVAGRDYVLPDDVQMVAPLVLAHRIVCNGGSMSRLQQKRNSIQQLLSEIQVPA